MFAGDGAFAIPNEFEESGLESEKSAAQTKPPSKIHFDSMRDPVQSNIPKAREGKLEENEEEDDEEVFLYEGEEEDYGYEDEYY